MIGVFRAMQKRSLRNNALCMTPMTVTVTPQIKYFIG